MFSNSHAQDQYANVNYNKPNFKNIVTYRENYQDIEVGTNVLRADYNVHYTNSKFTNPESIAKEYLKSISLELGVFNDLRNVKIIKTIASHTCTYVYFEQQLNNVPIFSSSSIVTVNKDNTVTALLNGFREVTLDDNISQTPKISENNAIQLAYEYLDFANNIEKLTKTELLIFDSNDKGCIFLRFWTLNPAESGQLFP